MLVSRTVDPLGKIHRKPSGTRSPVKSKFKLILRKMRNECCSGRCVLTCVCHALPFYDRRSSGTRRLACEVGTWEIHFDRPRLSRPRTHAQSRKTDGNETGAPVWDKEFGLKNWFAI